MTPTILEADADRRAAMESKPQAISQLLPQLTANGVVQQERDKGTSNLVETAQLSGENVSEAFPFDGRVATGEHHYGVHLRQNLFLAQLAWLIEGSPNSLGASISSSGGMIIAFSGSPAGR